MVGDRTNQEPPAAIEAQRAEAFGFRKLRRRDTLDHLPISNDLNRFDLVATVESAGDLDTDLLTCVEDMAGQMPVRLEPQQRAVRDKRPSAAKTFEPAVVIE